MYIKASSVCSANLTHSCSRCAGNPHSCCSQSQSESCVRFSLKHFRPKKKKKKKPQFFGLTTLLLLLFLLLLDWTVEEEEGEERSVATVRTLTWSVCCHPCAVWLSTSHCSHFAVFCCELWVASFCCFKTVDVFMSLIWVPLTEITSSHVGTVCWLRVIPSVSGVICMWSGREMNTGQQTSIKLGCGWCNFIFRSFWQNYKLRNPH